MLYQNQSDEAHERACADEISKVGYHVLLSGKKVPWDFAILKEGHMLSIAEFKYRTKVYDTLIIDKSKIDKLMTLNRDHKSRPLLFVKWDKVDGYWYWECHDRCRVDDFVRVNPRGVSGEEEELADVVYHIPQQEFRRWPNGETYY